MQIATSCTDPINRFCALINGASHHFYFYQQNKITGYIASKYLRSYGIGVYAYSARKTENGTVNGFWVRPEQAKWAEYLLCCKRVLLASPLLNPSNAIIYNKAVHGLINPPVPWCVPARISFSTFMLEFLANFACVKTDYSDVNDQWRKGLAKRRETVAQANRTAPRKRKTTRRSTSSKRMRVIRSLGELL